MTTKSFRAVVPIKTGTYTGFYGWVSGANWSPTGVPENADVLTVTAGGSASLVSVDDVRSLSGLTLTIGDHVTLIIAKGDDAEIGVQNFQSLGTGSLFQVDGHADIVNAAGGAYLVNAGSLEIDGINGAGTFRLAGGTLNFTQNANLASGTSFDFQGIGSATMIVTDTNDYINGWNWHVNNFALHDKIALGTSVFNPGTFGGLYNAAAHTVTVGKSGGGSFVFNNFTLAAGALNNWLITDTTIQLICFAEGTRIATARGPVRVEDLRAGDDALTLANGAQPVRWIGWRRVDGGGHARPAEVWPVCICAGAFGDGMPARELRLSPEHAIYVDGRLVPARALVNGTSIVQRPAGRVTYYHVELPRHDILLAEGLPVESWLDAGNRAMFENAQVAALHPSFAPGAAEARDPSAYAPLLEDGPDLDDIRSRLARRAAELGFGRARVQDVWIDAIGRHTAAIPAGTELVRIRSPRSGIAGDRRALGVSVRALAIDDVPLPLDDPSLGIGFHAAEHDGGAAWRWTDGAALLAVGDARTSRILTVEVASLAAAPLAMTA